MSKSHRKRYDNTGEYAYDRPRGEDVELNVYRPVSISGRRLGASGRRSASYSRRQLVVLVIDDSASMKGIKAVAATEAVRELLYQCKMKSNGDSIFDISLAWFGDYVFSDDKFMLKPVHEIDEDEIRFVGGSGGTRIKRVMQHTTDLIREYDKENLAFNEEKDRVPPPIIILMSDGKNGDGDPLPLASQLTDTPLSIGVPAMIVTVGIEFDGGEPDVELLTKMATETTKGQRLYFDISSADLLVECLATAGSSAASTPEELYKVIVQSQPTLKCLPSPKE